jgi:transcriptional regulator with XRE-family HTH domain
MFFQRLKDLREDRDLLQRDIAALLGIDQTVYSRYERGYQTIPVAHLLKLADFYHTSTDYILGRTNIITPYGNAGVAGSESFTQN